VLVLQVSDLPRNVVFPGCDEFSGFLSSLLICCLYGQPSGFSVHSGERPGPALHARRRPVAVPVPTTKRGARRIADQKYTTVRDISGEDLIEDSLRLLESEFRTAFVRIHRNALASACLPRGSHRCRCDPRPADPQQLPACPQRRVDAEAKDDCTTVEDG
jgi:hypothetical protein